jgi:hypothetical protein
MSREIIELCAKGDHEGAALYLRQNFGRIDHDYVDESAKTAVYYGHGRVLQVVCEYAIQVKMPMLDLLWSRMIQYHKDYIWRCETRDVRAVIFLNESVMISGPAKYAVLSKADVWRALRFLRVPRIRFQQTHEHHEEFIQEGEAEVACAKKMLLEHTTLPLDLVNLIVGRM